MVLWNKYKILLSALFPWLTHFLTFPMYFHCIILGSWILNWVTHYFNLHTIMKLIFLKYWRQLQYTLLFGSQITKYTIHYTVQGKKIKVKAIIDRWYIETYTHFYIYIYTCFYICVFTLINSENSIVILPKIFNMQATIILKSLWRS